MTREEAIKNIKEHCYFANLIPQAKEALDMAIKALEQEPCEDAISRQAVDELSKELVHTTKDKADFLCKFWEGLQKLPPVAPQQKRVGKWIRDKENCLYNKCSICCYGHCREDNYCPNCGAKMEGEKR